MKTTMSVIGAVVAAVLLATGCGGEEAASPSKEAVLQAPQDVNSITIRPELVQRITIGQPTMVNLADKLQVPSQVEVDEERLVRIGSYVTGRSSSYMSCWVTALMPELRWPVFPVLN